VKLGREGHLLRPRSTHDARAHVIQGAVGGCSCEVAVALGARLAVPASFRFLMEAKGSSWMGEEMEVSKLRERRGSWMKRSRIATFK
jgi:hypothetical protein